MKTHNAPPKFLNRFTTIPFLMDMLKHGQLTLINPALWDDCNDQVTLELYRHRKNKPAIYALCLTYSDKTSQHWGIFARGPRGCCIEFNYNKLMRSIPKNKALVRGKAEYVKINELDGLDADINRLPFLKRWPFSAEKEFRLVLLGDGPQANIHNISFSPHAINAITITDSLSKRKFDDIK